MNKKLISVSLVIAVLAVGGYYLKTKQSNAPMTGNQIANEATEFGRAIESGKPTICTMKKGDDTMEYLIKGKLMRMNSTTVATDDSGNSSVSIGHMINDSTYLYIWDDKIKQGSKMTIPTEEDSKELTDKAKDYQATAPKLETQTDFDNLKNEGYVIDCKSGNVDDSSFVPPTDVKFIDPTAMMNALPVQDENGKFDMSQIEEIQKQYGGQVPANY